MVNTKFLFVINDFCFVHRVKKLYHHKCEKHNVNTEVQPELIICNAEYLYLVSNFFLHIPMSNTKKES